jgi:hypothetical protein
MTYSVRHFSEPKAFGAHYAHLKQTHPNVNKHNRKQFTTELALRRWAEPSCQRLDAVQGFEIIVQEFTGIAPAFLSPICGLGDFQASQCEGSRSLNGASLPIGGRAVALVLAGSLSPLPVLKVHSRMADYSLRIRRTTQAIARLTVVLVPGIG